MLSGISFVFVLSSNSAGVNFAFHPFGVNKTSTGVDLIDLPLTHQISGLVPIEEMINFFHHLVMSIGKGLKTTTFHHLFPKAIYLIKKSRSSSSSSLPSLLSLPLPSSSSKEFIIIN
ncbi:Hypothetical predicted protein [Octopus vulgaris]|uniref:Uncharacterized protein n=1 Tax=Octopus vulgaris TaxID=6645 RepID=A0AA36FP96_OCTVU|nr:Hypothetical predicted protein [Octopus vulgaris]